MSIQNFTDFCAVLLESGFSMGGGNDKGIYAVIPFGWDEQGFADSPVRWHTGDPETDPWEWRMRVLEERGDIAYAKLFFRVSGYISAEWYPYFLAVRRGRASFADAYYSGTISHEAKRIYDTVSQAGAMPLHEIKARAGFGRESGAQFERALTELQTRMFLTMCGRAQKINQFGEGYGWNSTVFTTVEDFWAKRSVALPAVDAGEAYRRIETQILLLNPRAEAKKIAKFIKG